jgi:hypothetical protein
MSRATHDLGEEDSNLLRLSQPGGFTARSFGRWGTPTPLETAALLQTATSRRQGVSPGFVVVPTLTYAPYIGSSKHCLVFPSSFLRRVGQPKFALSILVVASTIVRTALTSGHSTPRYFPDEYIYAALGRSIGHGSLAVRGATAHFPALLEPLLAAPIWRLFTAETAYHLVQAENAFSASLAAVPVYFLARRLALSSGFSLLCSVYALLVPSLVLVAFVVSDPVGYVLALSAIAVGVSALDRPSTRAELAFVFFAICASLARVEYLALFPAYLAAAVVVDRRRVLQTQRVALISIVVPSVGAAAVAFGYYSAGLRSLRFDAGFGRWALLYLFLLTVESGVVMVPGAVAALLRPRGRVETVFACFAATLAMLLLIESTTPATDPSRFKERYLFALLPLVPIAFGLYLKHGQPLRYLVFALAAVTAVAVARLPLSQYAASTFKTDSQFLFAVSYAESRVGVGTGSLIVAVVATVGATAAALLAVRDFGRLAFMWVIAVSVATTAAAIRLDRQLSGRVRATLPHDLGWVDDAGGGSVTAIATRTGPSTPLREALFWNESIRRERVLPGAASTDPFSAPLLEIAPSGRLVGGAGEMLVDDFDATVSFVNSNRVARAPNLTLWRGASDPQLRLLIEGRFTDDWLTAGGRLRAWPSKGNLDGTSVTFALSLPRYWRTSVRLRLAHRVFIVHPGQRYRVVCRTGSGPVDVRFSSVDRVIGPDLRVFTARLSDVRVTDLERKSSSVAPATTCRVPDRA